MTTTLPLQVPVLALLSAMNLSAEMLMGALESCLPRTGDGAAANAGAMDSNSTRNAAHFICDFRSRSSVHAHPKSTHDLRGHTERNRPAWCPSAPDRRLRHVHA